MTTTAADVSGAIAEINAKVGIAVADIVTGAETVLQNETKINELLASLRTAGLIAT